MENNLHNIYLFRAIEAYPWELEKAVEALNYALSYEPENVRALCLMAQLQVEQLGDFELAKSYYQKALAVSLEIPNVYAEYIRFLINYGDLDEAQQLIDFALTVKGIDKAIIMINQGFLYEVKGEFDLAEEAIKEAKLFALNNEFFNYTDDAISRVNKKRKFVKSKEQKLESSQKKNEVQTKTNWFQNRLNNLL
ncbi:tetratricopeptide repeat protein [Gaetbulibacter jejuensis]|uniref:Tetratricopeptide repeat protein n=1 Tax=Gaetbulibacter jejuensis TaxID=584607 RepID=A0ABN1JEN5_9FLAO